MKSNRYNISLIRKYLNGELDARAMYELERKAQEDPLLADLMLGMESGYEEEHQQNLSEVDALIDKRIQQNDTPKIYPVLKYGIAASILFACAIAVFLATNQNSQPDLASRPKSPKSEISKQRPGTEKKSPELSAKLPDLQVSNPVKKKVDAEKHRSKIIARENTLAVLTKKEIPTQNLEEVVVVGYGVQRKRDLAGSSSSVGQAEFSDSIQNTLSGKVAGVNSKPKKAARTKVVKGVVTAKDTEEVLPGAIVRVKGTNTETITDKKGKFELEAPDNAILEIAYIGYNSEEIKARNNSNVTINLQPSQALSEVVVVGYGTVRKQTNRIVEAHPVTGWAAFRSYLKENARTNTSEKGIVIVSFAVSATGEISDTKIEKSLNIEADEKAIRLITEGPRWVGDQDGTTKEIKIKIRFR